MRKYRASGFTLIELLVAISIIGLLIALLLPAVQSSREAARGMQCRNNLHQLGLAFHNYHDVHQVFPPGCVGTSLSHVGAEAQAWGWGTMLLPHLEQANLYNEISPNAHSIGDVLTSDLLQPSLRTPLGLFRCPSDPGSELTHSYRSLNGFVLPAGSLARVDVDTLPSTRIAAGMPSRWNGSLASTAPWMHDFVLKSLIGHPLPPTPPPGPPPGGGVFGVPTSTSNYIGSFGDSWQSDCLFSSIDDLKGHGILGSYTAVRMRDIIDGTSLTLLAGERNTANYAAAWVGTDGWDRFDSQGLSMVLGTAAYNINQLPDPYHLSCDGKGAAGFSSMHPGGANFLFADGSVRFIGESIDSRNSTDPQQKGIFQRLSARNDGQSVDMP